MKEIIEKWIALYRARDASAISALYADDAEIFDASAAEVVGANGSVKGAKAIASLWEMLFMLEPEKQVEVRSVLEEGARVVLEWEHSGSRFADVFELDGSGRIRSQRTYWARR